VVEQVGTGKASSGPGIRSDREAAPLISVIVLTYNGEKYLDIQLDSIISQSHTNIEIIISDDASTDRTAKIAARYATEDSRVVLLQQSSNVGLSANLESALHAACGLYVAVSDQDDVWEENKLEVLLGSVAGASGAFSDSAIIDANGDDTGTTMMRHVGWRDGAIGSHYLRLLMDNCVSGHALLINRELALSILPFAPVPVYDQQLAFAAAYKKGLVYVPGLLVRHRQHAGNHNNKIIYSAPGKLSAKQRNRLAFGRMNSMLGILLFKLNAGSRESDIRSRLRFWFLAVLYRRTQRVDGKRFMMAAFLLLWPFRQDLLAASSGRRSTLRLFKLCRVG